MKAHLQRVLDRFPEARKVGRGWDARCPAHGDRNPSLTITMGDANPDAVVMRCGAGCDTADVLARVGLTLADLFPDSTRRTPARILREHTYYDDQGTVIYRVRRLDGKQRWSMVHPTDDGWTKGRGDRPKVLYRLPQLVAEPDVLNVWVTEGERDADALAERCGVLATTVASGSWTDVDASVLSGRYVIVVVDNDRTGWERGKRTIEAVERAGALVIDVWRPLDQFKDATDAIRVGKDCDSGFVHVDLEVDTPPVETWDHEPVRQLWTAVDGDGRSNFAIVPTGLLIAPTLDELDVYVFALCDDKAGKSGIAHLTQTQIADQLKKRRQTIGESLRRLEAGGWIVRPRRGRIVVKNPARNRTRPKGATPTPTPSPHEYPVPQRTSA
jgi:hypothetical protein